MTEIEAGYINSAVDSLANATDTAKGEELEKIISIMDTLFVMAGGGRGNVRKFLREHNHEIPEVAPDELTAAAECDSAMAGN